MQKREGLIQEQSSRADGGRSSANAKSRGLSPRSAQAVGRPRPGEGTYGLIRVDASKAGIPGDLSG